MKETPPPLNRREGVFFRVIPRTMRRIRALSNCIKNQAINQKFFTRELA